MSYIVKEISSKNDLILISVNKDEEIVKYLSTVSHFSDKPLHRDDLLEEEDIKWLEKENEYSKAFLLCLRKIGNKDRTIKEIREILDKDTPLDSKQTNELMDYLIERNYLDDERYLEDHIESLRLEYLGKNKIIYTLSSKGILKEKIVEELDKEDEIQEVQRGCKLAEKMLPLVNHKPLKAKKQTIRNKLFAKGYDNEIIEQVINKIDIPIDQEIVEDSLEKSYQKAYKHYSKKQSGLKLRNSLYRYLVSQGYDYQDIANRLNIQKEDTDD